MSGFRAYCDLSEISKTCGIKAGLELRLDNSESRHLCGSLRAKDGDVVDVFDLENNVARCTILDASQKSTLLKVQDILTPSIPQTQIYIAQSIPKGNAFEEILSGSVEIGASGIYPLISQRTTVKIEKNDAERKRQKWIAKSVEAVKQSANLSPYSIELPQRFDSFINCASSTFDVKLVASLRTNAKPILKVLQDNFTQAQYKRVCILIGPEGDFSPEEYDLAESVGFLPVKLGDNVMRSDTAALCALSITRAFF